MQLGAWQLDTINGGRFRIDGSVLFGLVPKVLWDPLAPVDSRNRVECGNRCILARDGRHTVLIDTGCGTKFMPLDRKFYALEEGDPLLDDLAAIDVRPEDVDTVVFTHLHFDHVGGATRFDGKGSSFPPFPKARYSSAGRSGTMRRLAVRSYKTAYAPDNLLPLAESGRLVLLNGDAAIVPGLSAFCTGGHTRGHLAVKFCSGGQTVLFSWATYAPPPRTCGGCRAPPTTFIPSIPAAASRNCWTRRPSGVG